LALAPGSSTIITTAAQCFEATGCGAVLLTDAGRYPHGFVESSPDQISGLIRRLLDDPVAANAVAKAGCAMVKDRYSKERQWEKFQELI
jgi:hypothetical protein